MEKMRYFSMFSGIGGFELGLQRASNKQLDRGRIRHSTLQDVRQRSNGKCSRSSND